MPPDSGLRRSAANRNFFERRRRGPTPTSLQFLDGADEGHRLRAISRSWQNLVKVSIQLVRVELQNAAQLGAGISSDEPDVSLGRTDDHKKQAVERMASWRLFPWGLPLGEAG